MKTAAILVGVTLAGAVAYGIATSDDPEPGTTGSTTIENLQPGQHTFEVQATDAAGNTDPTPASTSWTVRTPVNVNGSPQIALKVDQNETPVATATVGGPPAAAPSSIRWSINNVLKKTQTAPPFAYVNPPAGDYILSVKALAPDGAYAIVKQRVVR